MNRRDALHAIVSTGLLCLAPPLVAQADPAPPRVVFLNPGEAAERGTGPMWRTLAGFMTAAARDLAIELEIIYAERDHLLMLRQAEQVARRPRAPDYVVIVNEKMAARQMLEVLRTSSAKVLVLHNDLTDEQRREIGNEREKLTNWIGTVTSDDARGGYRLMEELYRQLGGREARVIGITGDPNTPVSLQRAQGVETYIRDTGQGRIHQLAFGDWGYADGEHKARVLLARYPDASAIWAANDSMALGALRAVRGRGAEVLVGGMGGWPDALESIIAGDLSATVAGHYLIGAWAMVLLHDYHHGADFAAHGGPRQLLDHLFVVNRENAPRFRTAILDRGETIDFGRYSKVRNPGPGPYQFSVEDLVGSMKAQ